MSEERTETDGEEGSPCTQTSGVAPQKPKTLPPPERVRPSDRPPASVREILVSAPPWTGRTAEDRPRPTQVLSCWRGREVKSALHRPPARARLASRETTTDDPASFLPSKFHLGWISVCRFPGDDRELHSRLSRIGRRRGRGVTDVRAGRNLECVVQKFIIDRECLPGIVAFVGRPARPPAPACLSAT